MTQIHEWLCIGACSRELVTIRMVAKMYGKWSLQRRLLRDMQEVSGKATIDISNFDSSQKIKFEWMNPRTKEWLNAKIKNSSNKQEVETPSNGRGND